MKQTDYSNLNVRNSIESIQNNISNKIDNGINNLPTPFRNRVKSRQLARAKKKFEKSAKRAEQMKKFGETFKKLGKIAKSIGSFIARFWIPIVIILVIVFLVIPLVFAYIMQIGNSPHYYCNLEAPNSVKSSAVYQQYCGSSTGGNDSIAQAAVSLAYYIPEINAVPTTYVAGKCQSGVTHGVTGKAGTYPADIATQLYVDVHDEVISGDGYYASCDRGTCTAVRWAGADDDFPPGDCGTIISYLDNHPDKWEKVGNIRDVELEPGDIMINSGHVGIYVGLEAVQEKYPNCTEDTQTYAASFGDYCPKLQDLWWIDDGTYTVYRNIKPEEASKYKDIQF